MSAPLASSRPGLLLAALLLGAPALRAADFNGDGYPDLAIGCHGGWVAAQQEAGAVHVFYGGPTCFGSFTEQVIDESSFGGFAFPDDFELFGLSMTSGDFDGDGYDDLAIDAGNEDVSGWDAAGTVFVIYGSPSGLDLERHDAFNQDTKGIKDKVEPGNFFFPDLSAEQFGRTLVSGDFDADGYDDLAAFVQETFGKGKKQKSFAGAVHIIKGSPTGLTVKGNKLLRQGKAGIPGKPTADAKFGWGMAVADFNQDGIDDLAIGAPGELVEGHVVILLGKAKKGLTGKHSVLIGEADCGGVPDPTKAHHFGEMLEVGDFTGSGVPQLVIGAPVLDVGAAEYAGGVYVLTLDPADLSISDAQLITRETPGIAGGVQAGADFGYALAAGDFDGDGDDDLAIGVPRDDIGEATDAGTVTVLTGSPAGLVAGDLLVDQDVTGVPEVAEDYDVLGGVLAAADYDDDGDADLIVGCAGETVGGASTAGGILVFEGSAGSLLDLAGGLWLDKSLTVVAGNPGSNDNFGSALGR
ncbi:MAG TPA: FG-GAP repeat protein [Planctomycetota bacterium]|nr:FG-GAP repeat protein [Planctomycetota bacterium]